MWAMHDEGDVEDILNLELQSRSTTNDEISDGIYEQEWVAGMLRTISRR
jgi:hypothetical protein